jgi:hypothetical protein
MHTMNEQPTITKPVTPAAGHTPLDGVGPALHHAADRVNEIASDSMDAIRDSARLYRNQLRCASDSAISHIRHQPVQSILIAALLGATAVTLVSLLRHRR